MVLPLIYGIGTALPVLVVAAVAGAGTLVVELAAVRLLECAHASPSCRSDDTRRGRARRIAKYAGLNTGAAWSPRGLLAATLTKDGKRAGIVQRVLIIDSAGNRNRFDFSKLSSVMEIPNLLAVQPFYFVQAGGGLYLNTEVAFDTCGFRELRSAPHLL